MGRPEGGLIEEEGGAKGVKKPIYQVKLVGLMCVDGSKNKVMCRVWGIVKEIADQTKVTLTIIMVKVPQ